MRRLLPIVIVTALSCGLATLATSQTPEESAAACLSELTGVTTALAEEDQGRAMVLLDMASEACDSAQSGLVDSLGEAPEPGDPAVRRLWDVALARAELYGSVSQCDEARRLIQRTAGNIPLADGMEAEFANAAHAAFACGQAPGTASGGTITMSPLSPDQTQSGQAVSEVAASSLGAECTGYIPLDPSYRLEVTEDMQLSIAAYSTYGGDLVLAVTGPGGTFCNDDWDGVDPALSNWFAAGTYSVFVGEYSDSGVASDFSINFSANSLIAPYVYPTYGSAYLGTGYGRTTLSGTVYGVAEASTRFDASCSGWIADNPDFQMTIEGSSEAYVAVTGAVGTDLTLVIDGPPGRFCHDDDTGSDPTFHETLAAGTYNVWVGDNAGASTGASYGIQFSTYDPMLVLESEPTHGIATVGAGTGAPIVLTGRAVSGIPATDFFGSSCVGNVGAAPSHRLVIEEDAMVEVVARGVGYDHDLVLVVSGPAGTFCNDDFDGLNPGMRRWLTAGEYAVYVGPLSSYSLETDFHTTITRIEGTPPLDLATASGVFGSATLDYSMTASTFSGTSGGPNAASTMEPSCSGYISEEPSFVVDVTTSNTVSVSVMSQGDTTLVLSGPDGIICNDDLVGTNPGIEQYLSPGRYGVWVGSYSAGATHPFMINFRSLYY